MKEKRYTLPEEQKDAAFAAEPAPAYHGNAAIALPEDECAEEDIDWNKIPVGWHPANEEEAMARIEAIEAEYERTGISYSVEEFFNKLNEERTWLTNKEQEDKIMSRPIRETPILYGKDAERFVEEMKRVESLTPEQRKANREKLQAEIAVLDKEWNLTYNALRG